MAALNIHYAPLMTGDGFVPLTAVDESGNVIGHLFIRYPDKTDKHIVRLGYVIVNPAMRGCGNGKEMLQLAVDYAKEVLHVSKITLGVFTNNDNARHCYEAVGFCPVGKSEKYKMTIGEWECIEMELAIS